MIPHFFFFRCRAKKGDHLASPFSEKGSLSSFTNSPMILLFLPPPLPLNPLFPFQRKKRRRSRKGGEVVAAPPKDPGPLLLKVGVSSRCGTDSSLSLPGGVPPSLLFGEEEGVEMGTPSQEEAWIPFPFFSPKRTLGARSSLFFFFPPKHHPRSPFPEKIVVIFCD